MNRSFLAVVCILAWLMAMVANSLGGQDRTRDIPGGSIPSPATLTGGPPPSGPGGHTIASEPVVYVDDGWEGIGIGLDPDGIGPAVAMGTDAFATIQEGIDAASAGGVVNVYPGDYNEVASGRYVLGTSGPYQFGLFVGLGKDGITIQGVDASSIPITDYSNVTANVTTNATNNFGYSGTFVEADNVTITGLKILNNVPGDNKTFEVIGDDFTVMYCWFFIFDYGGSLYFNDWRFDEGTSTSYVQSYHVEANLFDYGTSIDLASGAGYSGPVAGRLIINNAFKPADPSYQQNWNYVSFNGSGTGVEWFIYSVGGAIITGNTFDAQTTQYIRARGDYDNAQFDWSSYWNDNTFGTSVAVGPNPPVDLREWSYVSGSYTFNHVRHISGVIQEEIGHAVADDEVLVGPGTYYESPNIVTPLTLKASQGRDVTNIVLQTGPTYLGALTVGTPDVAIEGFTITGFDGTPTTLASSNIIVTTAASHAEVRDNRILVGNTDISTNFDDGIGILTHYAASVPPPIDSVVVEGNIFQPVNLLGSRAFYVNPGVDYFLFKGNTVSAGLGRSGIQAMNSLIEDNSVTGSGTAGDRRGGMFTWGYPDPLVWGHASFRNNHFSETKSGIAIFSANTNSIESNTFDMNDYGVLVQDLDGFPGFDPSTSEIHYNSFTNSAIAGIQNMETTSIDATCNYYGSETGPTHPSNPGGTGDVVSDYVMFDPWFAVDLGEETQYIYSPYLTSLTLTPVVNACGTSPYGYQWSPGGETTPSITVTEGGVYSVTVTDANGGTATDDVTVVKEVVETCGNGNKFFLNHYGRRICVARSGIADHLAHGDSFYALSKNGPGELDVGSAPQVFSMSQNYPNPFNPKTLITYDVAEDAFVTITVYNVLGQTVGTLVSEARQIGRYTVEFDGTAFGSGVYYYRMQAGSFSEMKKLLLLK